MAAAQEPEDSVYDFLYIDARRISHFLSQLTQYGSIVSLTRAVSESNTSGGGINVVAAKMDTASSQQTTQTRQFDAQWIAPLTFLDEASKRGMIRVGLEHARIGNLVLISGSLSLFDLSVIKAAWEIPGVKTMMLKAISTPDGQVPEQAGGNRQERRRHAREKSGPAVMPEREVGFEMLKNLPHATLAALNVGSASVWTTLREDSLVVAASDILLKHGVNIAGVWNIVGILDAFPDDDESALNNFVGGASLGSLGEFVGTFGPATRTLLGRPAESYGMTPLLIFREVNA
jgi:hypothetical protein